MSTAVRNWASTLLAQRNASRPTESAATGTGVWMVPEETAAARTRNDTEQAAAAVSAPHCPRRMDAPTTTSR